jgi:hypothetical protein
MGKGKGVEGLEELVNGGSKGSPTGAAFRGQGESEYGSGVAIARVHVRTHVRQQPRS